MRAEAPFKEIDSDIQRQNRDKYLLNVKNRLYCAVQCTRCVGREEPNLPVG